MIVRVTQRACYKIVIFLDLSHCFGTSTPFYASGQRLGIFFYIYACKCYLFIYVQEVILIFGQQLMLVLLGTENMNKKRSPSVFLPPQFSFTRERKLITQNEISNLPLKYKVHEKNCLFCWFDKKKGYRFYQLPLRQGANLLPPLFLLLRLL